MRKAVISAAILTNSMTPSLYNNYEKGDAMYYELYVDSLFLVNFVMNLYLLLLVNQKLCRTATRIRMILGAATGAVVYILPFFFEGPAHLKLILGFAVGGGLMIFITFRVKTVKAALKIVEILFCYSFLMGGALLFLMKRVPFFQKHSDGIFGIMGMGAFIYFLVSHLQKRRQREKKLCSVTLVCKEGKMKLTALVDSGNSLVEPISGKPVSIMESEIFHGLCKDESAIYRAIPYTSIGKNRGILKGYLFTEMQIEVGGVTKKCRDVYIAVSEEKITGTDADNRIRMIVNPALLEQ